MQTADTINTDHRPRSSASYWRPSPELARDLEAAYAALPRPTPRAPTAEGAAGRRLQDGVTGIISDDLLKEFARDRLGAQRVSAKYLDALRVVLGNQAQAERDGFVLEMNQRVQFAPEKVMRNIIDQMCAAEITRGRAVGLGNGRRQVVQCFVSAEERAPMYWINGFGDARHVEELERMYRRHEGVRRYDFGLHPDIHDLDVPAWAEPLRAQSKVTPGIPQTFETAGCDHHEILLV